MVNRNICNFQQFLGKFLPCLLHLLIYGHFFAWYHGTQMYYISLRYIHKNMLKYWIMNTLWIIAFYIGILAIFGNFGVNFCLIHSNRWFFHCIFASNHGRHILWFRKIQKIDPVLKYDENFWIKLPKIAKFNVNWEYQGKFWTNWESNA